MMMLSLERLIREHEQLDALAERIETCAASADADAETAIRLKTELSMTLAHHLGGEDAELYPKLATSGDPALVGAADTFQSELADLKVDWAAYLEEWCDDAVHDDWATFRDETRGMMARLRARIARESACLYPLALQRSQVSLRTS